MSHSSSTSPPSLSFRRIWSGEVDAHQLALSDRPVLPWLPRPFTQNQKNCAGNIFFFTSLCRVFCHVVLYITRLDMLCTVRLWHRCSTSLSEVKMSWCVSSCEAMPFLQLVRQLFLSVLLLLAPWQTFSTNLHIVAFHISSPSIDAIYGTFLWIVCVV